MILFGARGTGKSTLPTDLPDAEAFLSRDPHPQRLGPILALPWWEGVLAL